MWRVTVLPSLALASLVLLGQAQAGKISVFATGLDNPRGLTFGPDGFLYVAEAGLGGTPRPLTSARSCRCPRRVATR